VYSVSDLIVCRSGAGSNEISRLAKPALLIPKANLPGDHQVMNARAMKHAGRGNPFEDTVVEHGQVLEKVGGETLADRIWGLLKHPRSCRDVGQQRWVLRNMPSNAY
jgi:UDP-N-acetylglucosamine--N-acetylmuramyl-(pentapeptide) pyrophosphoryl-undecaprenol N-acetylglucosamine transferase